MTTTLLDPRLELCRQRRTMLGKLADMRTYSGTLCGCTQCGDAELIEEQTALITRAVEAIAELSNKICEREPTCTRS